MSQDDNTPTLGKKTEEKSGVVDNTPIPFLCSHRHVGLDGRVSAMSVDTMSICDNDRHLNPDDTTSIQQGPIPHNRLHEQDGWHSRNIGKPNWVTGKQGKVYYNTKGMAVRCTYYKEGKLDGVNLCSFEVPRILSGTPFNWLPTDPYDLLDLPDRLEPHLAVLRNTEILEYGTVSRFDFNVQVLIKSERESQRVIRFLDDLRQYRGYRDCSIPKKKALPLPLQGAKRTGIGMVSTHRPNPNRKKEAKDFWSIVAYRLDKKPDDDWVERQTLCTRVMRLEFRSLGGATVAKFLPVGMRRTLKNVIHHFDFFVAANWFLEEKLGIHNVADPSFSDDEIIKYSDHQESIKKRLQTLLTACRKTSFPELQQNLPTVYANNPEMLDADLRRLDVLGILPYSDDREIAVMLREAIFGAALRFQQDIEAARRSYAEARMYTVAEVAQQTDTQNGCCRRHVYRYRLWAWITPVSLPVRICLICADGEERRTTTMDGSSSQSRAPPPVPVTS
ncbi:MAG: hypothetical protein P9L99_04260 [Candidatus Lernaella stagnicola]|nr:hypothetical protein [Candidatus Lernaella stagnicola]